MALTEKLTNIADAIRTKTGSADKLTLDGMAQAIAGIEIGGGSGGGTSGIYMAKITPAEDVGGFTITHNLGTTDILLAAVFAESFGSFTPGRSGSLSHLWAKTEIPIIRGGNGYDMNFRYDTGNQYITYAMAAASGRFVTFPDGDTAYFPAAGSTAATKFFAGVTYTVIVMAASAFAEV